MITWSGRQQIDFNDPRSPAVSPQHILCSPPTLSSGLLQAYSMYFSSENMVTTVDSLTWCGFNGQLVRAIPLLQYSKTIEPQREELCINKSRQQTRTFGTSIHSVWMSNHFMFTNWNRTQEFLPGFPTPRSRRSNQPFGKKVRRKT
jgi:hypothetical protein